MNLPRKSNQAGAFPYSQSLREIDGSFARAVAQGIDVDTVFDDDKTAMAPPDRRKKFKEVLMCILGDADE